MPPALYLVRDVADVPERNGARLRIVRPQTAQARQGRLTSSAAGRCPSGIWNASPGSSRAPRYAGLPGQGRSYCPADRAIGIGEVQSCFGYRGGPGAAHG